MAEEQAVKAEEKTPEGAAPSEQKAAKKKKINRLALDEINKKIEALMQANQTKSRYYQHLLQRKNELQAQ
jgi:hypothetical protein